MDPKHFSFIKLYLMLFQDGTLSIYETPSFGLLDKKSIKVTLFVKATMYYITLLCVLNNELLCRDNV